MRINSGGWSDESQFWISVKIRRRQKVTVELAQNFARGTMNWVWTEISQNPGMLKIKLAIYVKVTFEAETSPKNHKSISI